MSDPILEAVQRSREALVNRVLELEAEVARLLDEVTDRAMDAESRATRAEQLADALLAECPGCHGKGEREAACRYCGDSTYDHECESRMVPCSDCAWVRRALEAQHAAAHRKTP